VAEAKTTGSFMARGANKAVEKTEGLKKRGKLQRQNKPTGRSLHGV